MILTSTNLVPVTAVKCLLSLVTFCLGVLNTMKTDKISEKRGVRTSTVQKIKEFILTLFLTVVPLAGLVFHVGCLVLISTIAIFSWSWTEETPEPHHICFLLPFLPFCLAFVVQFLLFQKYVKPRNAKEQRFAFLSLILPVRIFLVKNRDRAFKYYTLSVSNIWGSVLMSLLLLIAAVANLSGTEDSDRQLLVMAVEVVLPQFLWAIHLMLVASMLLWYFVIYPGIQTDHFCPDHQSFQDRIATFPFYWSHHFCNLLLRERLKIEGLEQTSEPGLSEWADLLCEIQTQEGKDTEGKPETSRRCLSMEESSKELTNFEVLNETNETSTVRAENLVKRMMLDIKDTATPHHLASEGFFYSHPRMTGLQVF